MIDPPPAFAHGPGFAVRVAQEKKPLGMDTKLAVPE